MTCKLELLVEDRCLTCQT